MMMMMTTTTMMMMTMMMTMMMMMKLRAQIILARRVQPPSSYAMDLALASAVPGEHRPPDTARRRWFLQDFAATSLSDRQMDLRAAVEGIARMERALRTRQGVELDRFMHQCWDPAARPHFEASFRSEFGQPFMHPALQRDLQSRSSSSEPEFLDGSSQPHDANRRPEPMDTSDKGGENAAMPQAELDREWQLELATSDDSERRWDRMPGWCGGVLHCWRVWAAG